MELILSRRLEIHCFEVFAEVAKAERRQEIQSILLLAQENGGRLTPELVCRDLLGGRPTVVGRTIIQRCRGYHLLEGNDDESYLTEEGHKSASRGVVFIPEKGKYRIWVTDDPLFTDAALDIEPVKEAALSVDDVHASQHAPGRRGDNTRRGTRGVPEDMNGQSDALRGRVFTPLKPGSQQYQINFVAPEWVRVEDAEAHPQSRITWTARADDLGKVRVDGAYRAEGLAPPQVSFEKLWLGLLGRNAVDWDVAEDGAYLRCAFDGDGLTDANRRTFRRVLTFETPSIPDLGEFDPLEVEDVPIAPRKPGDAQAWAEWLLEDRISSYLDEKSFAALQHEVRRAFPEFEVSLPGIPQLLAHIRQRAERGDTGRLPASFWYLQAPRDLVEMGISPADGELVNGAKVDSGMSQVSARSRAERPRRF